MKCMKKQLRKFYEANGVGVRRAEKLIKSDLAAIRREPGSILWPSVDIAGSFHWRVSAQGWKYWAVRDDGLSIADDIPYDNMKTPASLFHA